MADPIAFQAAIVHIVPRIRVGDFDCGFDLDFSTPRAIAAACILVYALAVRKPHAAILAIAATALDIPLVLLALTVHSIFEGATLRSQIRTVALAVLGALFFWSANGSFTPAGYAPSFEPRMVVSQRDATDTTLTVLSPPSALVYVDESRAAFGRAPFERKLLTSGYHSFRIHPNGPGDDTLLTSIKARGDVTIALDGASTRLSDKRLRGVIAIAVGLLALGALLSCAGPIELVALAAVFAPLGSLPDVVASAALGAIVALALFVRGERLLFYERAGLIATALVFGHADIMLAIAVCGVCAMLARAKRWAELAASIAVVALVGRLAGQDPWLALAVTLIHAIALVLGRSENEKSKRDVAWIGAAVLAGLGVLRIPTSMPGAIAMGLLAAMSVTSTLVRTRGMPPVIRVPKLDLFREAPHARPLSPRWSLAPAKWMAALALVAEVGVIAFLVRGRVDGVALVFLGALAALVACVVASSIDGRALSALIAGCVALLFVFAPHVPSARWAIALAAVIGAFFPFHAWTRRVPPSVVAVLRLAAVYVMVRSLIRLPEDDANRLAVLGAIAATWGAWTRNPAVALGGIVMLGLGSSTDIGIASVVVAGIGSSFAMLLGRGTAVCAFGSIAIALSAYGALATHPILAVITATASAIAFLPARRARFWSVEVALVGLGLFPALVFHPLAAFLRTLTERFIE